MLNLIALIIYLTFFLQFVFGMGLIPIIIIQKYFPQSNKYINLLKNIINVSISFISHTLLFNNNIYVDSNKYIEEIQNDKTNSNLIISNHIIDLDFLIHTIIFSNTNFNSKNIGISKKFVGYQLPIYGLLGNISGDIFINRNISTDFSKLNKKMIFNNLLIFPEGTCFTNERKNISDKFCDKNNLIKFDYHLYPRMTGIKTIINSNPNIKYIYDITIVYDKISPIKYGKHYCVFSYLYNLYKFPNKVFIKISKYKLAHSNLENQIEKIFYHKDKFIFNFNHGTNKFIPIKYNYFKGFFCFMGTNLLILSSMLLFVKYSFIKYLYGLEFILYMIYFLLFV